MLTEKQKCFCEEYLYDLNATAAYERAGYTAKNKNTAGVSAANLLKDPKIQAYIQKLQQQRSRRTEITNDRVLEEIAKIAFSDITNVISFDDSGINLKKSSALEARVTGAILEVTSEKSETSAGKQHFVNTKKKVKMYDKIRALEILARYLGMTNDFNAAIATFRKYGLAIKQNEAGSWIVEDASKETVEEVEEGAIS